MVIFYVQWVEVRGSCLQKYGRIKPVNGIPILPLLVTRSPTAIQI
jgi:hypothetical protein